MEEKNSINNANQMNSQLSNVFSDLRNGTIDVKSAVAAAKVCDAITRNLRNQLEYKRITGRTNKIAFLE